MSVASEMLDNSISDPEVLYHIARFIKIAVSTLNPEPIINHVIKIGIVPKLSSLLKVPLEKIQLAVTEALINIAHTNNDQILRKEGIHIELVTLAANSKDIICENVS
jgi:hypothetical protein